MTYPTRPIEPPKTQIKEEDIDTTLRSFNEVLGYKVFTRDGNHGHLDDIIIDDENWQILYFVITDGNLLGEQRIMFPISWIDKISYKDQHVELNINSGDLQDAPDYNPEYPVNTEYEKKVYDYYGRLLNK
jgi:sporulation protein YlmC with PRC-barrel domain